MRQVPQQSGPTSASSPGNPRSVADSLIVEHGLDGAMLWEIEDIVRLVDRWEATSGRNLTLGTVRKGPYPRQPVGSCGTQTLGGNH